MVLKAKSDTPIKLIKNNASFSTWQVPELDFGKAPGFRQPVDEVEEEEVSEEEQEKITAEELQAIRDAAHQEGFQAGQKEGLAAAKDLVEKQSALMQQVISQLSKPLEQCGKQTQHELLQLAFAIARQIVRRELQQDPSQLIAIIREALKLLPIGSQNIEISLHPEDATIVKNALSIDGQSESGNTNWQLKSDPSVEKGSCQVITENSKIDASIDKQIAVLFSRIAGGQRAGESDVE
ncbi:flagellar assembly protein FliH [Aliikangiella sp. IMCC44359]|uniref:flagellar assembly protein FliH n=1 Tax=Aliikangiella sp. IMCC44359 TaxID=3459125 RepID=UPI00403AAFBA